MISRSVSLRRSKIDSTSIGDSASALVLRTSFNEKIKNREMIKFHLIPPPRKYLRVILSIFPSIRFSLPRREFFTTERLSAEKNRLREMAVEFESHGRPLKRQTERSLIAASFHRETGSQPNGVQFRQASGSTRVTRASAGVRMPEIAKLFPGLVARFGPRETRPTRWYSHGIATRRVPTYAARLELARSRHRVHPRPGKFATTAAS